MIRRVAYLTASAGMALLVAGCALNFLGGERREAWRDQEERSCLRSRDVVETAYIQRVKEIDGRGACGIDRPLKVSAFSDGRVSIGPIATLGCPMTAAIDRWMQTVVQPAAIAWFGMPIVELKQMGTYSCRTRNNVHGARLSEHAFGNALDISGFKFANGQSVTVKRDFLRGPEEAQGFLREVFAGACAQFKTVLGPGARYHDDHFHLDLAHHNATGTSRYCKPTPFGPPPMRPPYRGDRMASYPADSGPMLSQAPPDVVADTTDPFGAAAMQDRPRSDMNSGPVDAYGGNDVANADAGNAGAYPPDDGYVDPNAGYDAATPETSVAAVPQQPEWPTEPPPRRKHQGFFSWFFKPKPLADIPLSYAP